jgi:large subunit ribosomal protein L25
METIAIQGNVRQELGKKATKALRREALVPCELYGGNENIHFSASKRDLKDIIYTPNFYKAGIQVDGKTYEAIIKHIQFHPVTDEVLHIDFQELVAGTVLRTEVPVRPVGVAAGVKVGGKLLVNVRKLKVKTTPENLIDKIEIDVSKLRLGQSFKVRDIKDTGMEIINAKSIPIAAVEIPRSLRGADAKADAMAGQDDEETNDDAEA